jgi:hypothetical protein
MGNRWVLWLLSQVSLRWMGRVRRRLTGRRHALLFVAGVTLVASAAAPAVALGSTVPIAYVTNYHTGDVIPIQIPDQSDFNVEAPIPLGLSTDPLGIAASTDGTAVFAAQSNSGGVAAVDTGGGSLLGTLAAGSQPQGVAITPDDHLLIANWGDDSVTKIDLSSGSTDTINLSGVVPGGNPEFIAVSPDGHTAYVSVTDSLVPIDLTTDQPGSAIALQGTPSDASCGSGGTVNGGGVAVSPDGSTVAVTCAFNAAVDLINTTTHAVTVVQLNGSSTGNASQVAITPDGTTAVVSWHTLGQGELSFIKLSDDTLTTLNFPDQYPEGIAITPDGSTGLVAGGSEIRVVHLSGLRSIDSTAIPNPDGDSAGATMIAIAQVPLPTDQTGPTISGTAQQGQTLTEAHGTWTGSPTSYSYQWEQCDSAGNGCTPISRATSQSYSPTAGDVDHTLRVQETATNAAGDSLSPATSAATAVVVPGPPVNSAAPTISGTTQPGQTLTEAHGTWTGSPTSYSYQWEQCDSAGNGCTPISGAHSQTYTLTAGDVDHRMRVQEVATNSGGSSTAATSAATALVQAPAAPPPNSPSGPTAQQVFAALMSLLTGDVVSLSRLLNHGVASLAFSSPSAGQLVIVWYLVPAGAHVSKAKPLIIGRGQHRFVRRSRGKVKVTLTRKGRRLLRHKGHAKLVSKATFTPVGRKGTTIQRPVRLKH